MAYSQPFHKFNSEFLDGDAELTLKVLNSPFFSLGNAQYAELMRPPVINSTLKLRKSILEQFMMLNKFSKINPSTNIKLEFDMKFFNQQFDRIERKMERINEDYLTCLDSLEQY
jgi:hypothetical protein